MKKDYKNRTLTFDSPEEEVKYNKHMAQFGPGTENGSHPDDCPYCKRHGWDAFPGTTFEEECDKWAAEHPEEVERLPD